jgi:hypothetical protein
MVLAHSGWQIMREGRKFMESGREEETGDGINAALG